MQRFAEGMSTLAKQLYRLKQVQKSDQLRQAVSKFLEITEEVVDFIEKWLDSWFGTC